MVSSCPLSVTMEKGTQNGSESWVFHHIIVGFLSFSLVSLEFSSKAINVLVNEMIMVN